MTCRIRRSRSSRRGHGMSEAFDIPACEIAEDLQSTFEGLTAIQEEVGTYKKDKKRVWSRVLS
jgi:hypothetical protein